MPKVRQLEAEGRSAEDSTWGYGVFYSNIAGAHRHPGAISARLDIGYLHDGIVFKVVSASSHLFWPA